MAQNNFAVIGLGQFGNAIARTLARRGAEVLAIDSDAETVDNIKEEVSAAVCLDATDIKALRSQNIQDVDGVVVAIGEDFESHGKGKWQTPTYDPAEDRRKRDLITRE
jgi:trk system potassium uptake protein TrkA